MHSKLAGEPEERYGGLRDPLDDPVLLKGTWYTASWLYAARLRASMHHRFNNASSSHAAITPPIYRRWAQSSILRVGLFRRVHVSTDDTYRMRLKIAPSAGSSRIVYTLDGIRLTEQTPQHRGTAEQALGRSSPVAEVIAIYDDRVRLPTTPKGWRRSQRP